MRTGKKITNGLMVAVAAMGVMVGATGTVSAQTPVVGGITGSASSQYTGRTVSDMLDGFGFNGTNFTFPGTNPEVGLSAGTVTDPTTGFTIPIHSANVAHGWLSNEGAFPINFLAFDLGTARKIAYIWIYNSPEGGNRTIKDTGTVETSLDGVSWTPQPSLSSNTIPVLDAERDNPAMLNVGGLTFRHIRFSDLSTHEANSGPHAGLGEIIFFEDAAPSEGGAIRPRTIVLEVTGCFGSFKWQSSANKSTWSDVAGATETYLDVTALYTNTPWFRVEATIGTNAPAYSDTMRVDSTEGPSAGLTFTK